MLPLLLLAASAVADSDIEPSEGLSRPAYLPSFADVSVSGFWSGGENTEARFGAAVETRLAWRALDFSARGSSDGTPSITLDASVRGGFGLLILGAGVSGRWTSDGAFGLGPAFDVGLSLPFFSLDPSPSHLTSTLGGVFPTWRDGGERIVRYRADWMRIVRGFGLSFEFESSQRGLAAEPGHTTASNLKLSFGIGWGVPLPARGR